MRTQRWVAGGLFALAGAAAAAAHVGLGAALRPQGAARGALAALGGMAGFVAVFALGHGLIEAARGAQGAPGLALEAAGRALAVMAGPAGAVALAGGAAAGALARRRG